MKPSIFFVLAAVFFSSVCVAENVKPEGDNETPLVVKDSTQTTEQTTDDSSEEAEPDCDS